jgi:hypothetical protein
MPVLILSSDKMLALYTDMPFCPADVTQMQRGFKSSLLKFERVRMYGDYPLSFTRSLLFMFGLQIQNQVNFKKCLIQQAKSQYKGQGSECVDTYCSENPASYMA